MLGKYSPTVSNWYSADQDWFEKNGGDFGNGINPDSLLDDDGYDEYGYTDVSDGYDRAGNREEDYMLEEGEALYADSFWEWSRKPLPHLSKQR